MFFLYIYLRLADCCPKLVPPGDPRIGPGPIQAANQPARFRGCAGTGLCPRCRFVEQLMWVFP